MKTAFAQNTRRFSFTGTAYFGLLGVITWMIALPLQAETAAGDPTTLPSEGGGHGNLVIGPGRIKV